MVWNEAATLLHKAQQLEKPPFIFTVFLAFFIGLAAFFYFINNRRTRALQGIPPGTFGWPVIGETLEFLGCQRRGSPQDFFKTRTQKYGNVFTTSLVGHPTVVLCSPEGNRFLFSNENKLVVNSWPTSVANLFPDSLITAVGDDAKRLRRILMTFLRPEALQKFVGRVDLLTKTHLAEYWIGKDEVTALPLLKRYTFSLACDLFATINNPDEQSKLWHHFVVFVKGVMQIPIDLPGTRYNKAKHAANAIRQQLGSNINERKYALEVGKASPEQDLLSFLLSNVDEQGASLTDDEIQDNILLLLYAGHDTSSSTLTMVLKFLAENPQCYEEVLKEQLDIASSKKGGQLLEWEDLQRMKYSWRVGQEALRLYPAAQGSFRKAIKDFTYEGFTIPKGWKLHWTINSTHRKSAKTGDQFGFVQFPQVLHGITKNDIYGNSLRTFAEIDFKGQDGIDGPFFVGTGCIHRREALCRTERRQSSSNYHKVASTIVCAEETVAKDKASSSKMLKDARELANCTYEDNTLWGKEFGMIYGCAVEDILSGFVIQCKGWRSIYCNPRRSAFLGCAPNNLIDTLTQHKRWAVGHLQLFVSKFCPYIYGIHRIQIAQRMCYSCYTLWSLSSMHKLCYGLIPGLCMLRGISLFPKLSSSCFFLFPLLAISAYGYSLFEYIWIVGSLNRWWNEQRMWMIKGVSAYLFALIEFAGKMIGVSEVGFEVTNKVVDSEAAKRYEAEIFEFGVASPLFVPPATLVVINLIAVMGGLARILREGYSAFECMTLQLILCSFIVINGYPILEAMFLRKDKGRIPTSITIFSTLVAASVCSVASMAIPSR